VLGTELHGQTTVGVTIVRTYEGPYGELLIVETSVANRALQLFLAPPAVMKKQGFVFDKGAVTEAIGMPGFKVNGLPALLTRRDFGQSGPCGCAIRAAGLYGTDPAVGQIRIADTGLILAARRAGSQLAASTAVRKTAAVVPSVSGS